jgi:aryl-alcohol dehydrogenase-like predicted oxidoreductase
VALGCWPLAGITSGAITDATALAVMHAALDAGINHLDTAYAYGRSGESETRIARALAGRSEQVVMATKVGVYWNEQGELRLTGRPALLRTHLEASLRRLERDCVDLLYFHAPADDTPLAETAGFFRDLITEGKARAIGVSNLSVTQLEQFQAECPVAACQMRYNWLQREIEADVLPWCRAHGVSVVAYEPLALGLLTGKFHRDHVFAEDDWRRRSPLFNGDAWDRNLNEVERLRSVADERNCSVSQLSVAWVAAQAGVATALCGAKSPEQIRETALVATLPELQGPIPL